MNEDDNKQNCLTCVDKGSKKRRTTSALKHAGVEPSSIGSVKPQVHNNCKNFRAYKTTEYSNKDTSMNNQN